MYRTCSLEIEALSKLFVDGGAAEAVPVEIALTDAFVSLSVVNV